MTNQKLLEKNAEKRTIEKSIEEYIIENGKYLLITLNSIDISGKLKVEHKTVNINDNSLKKNKDVV